MKSFSQIFDDSSIRFSLLESLLLLLQFTSKRISTLVGLYEIF
jgi:hypothetical protein